MSRTPSGEGRRLVRHKPGEVDPLAQAAVAVRMVSSMSGAFASGMRAQVGEDCCSRRPKFTAGHPSAEHRRLL